MLFEKKNPVIEEKPLTLEEAQKIYGDFEAGIDETRMFTEKGVPFKKSKIVLTEIRRLEAEVNQKMVGSFVVTPEIPEVRDENDKIIQEFVPAIYFVVKDEKMLVESLKSELLDVQILVTDVRRFSDGHPDDAPTFKDWLESFKKEM